MRQWRFIARYAKSNPAEWYRDVIVLLAVALVCLLLIAGHMTLHAPPPPIVPSLQRTNVAEAWMWEGCWPTFVDGLGWRSNRDSDWTCVV